MIISVFDRVKLTQDVGDFKTGTKAVVFSLTVKVVDYENSTNVYILYDLDVGGHHLHEVPETAFKQLRRVNVEDIYKLDRQIKYINGLRISDIEIYRDGKLLDIDPYRIDARYKNSLSLIEYILRVVSDEQFKES